METSQRPIYMKTKTESGLYIGKKLKREHIYLTPLSKMRVDLATQVLNDSCSHNNTCRMYYISLLTFFEGFE